MDDKQNIIIYRTSDGRASVALYAKDGKIWLNQQQMAELFATSKQLISHHIANILKDKELDGFSVVKQYLTTAADGKARVLFPISKQKTLSRAYTTPSMPSVNNLMLSRPMTKISKYWKN